MLHILAERIAFFVYKKNDLLPFGIYVYGFELIISSVIETSALIIAGCLIGRFIETILFLLSFSSLRFFSGGYHAKSYLRCFIITLFSYVLILLMNDFLIMLDAVVIAMIAFSEFLVTLIIFIIISPVESKEKEITNPRRQKLLSIVSLCINIGLVLIAVLAANNNILVIVLPTIIIVDALMIIEKLKQGVEKNENNKGNL